MTDRPWWSRKAGGGPLDKEPYVLSSYAGPGLHLVCERLQNHANRHEHLRARSPFATGAIARVPSPARSPLVALDKAFLVRIWSARDREITRITRVNCSLRARSSTTVDWARVVDGSAHPSTLVWPSTPNVAYESIR